jgi:hypothetical protein
MPREQLLGLAADVGRLLAAGSPAASGHDGLARRARALRELGAKVPTLAAVADAVERVTAAGPKQAGPAFLDLVVLTRQIRGSLSAAGADGPIEAVPASGPWQTAASLRDIDPVYEALSRSGEGREQTLRDAVGRRAVGDLRLVPALLEALSDGYTPVADLVASEALPALGKAVLPDLLSRADLQGKKPEARALRAVCKIDAARGAGLCRQALAEGSNTLREAALECLPDVGKPGEAERVGLKFCQEKARDVRVAAVRALRVGTSDEALEAVVGLLQDKELQVSLAAEEVLTELPHPQTTPRLLRDLEAVLPGVPVKGAKPSARGQRASDAEQNLERAVRLVRILGLREDGQRLAAAGAVLPLVRHNHPQLRVAALGALAHLGPVTDAVIPACLEALREKHAATQKAALEALRPVEPGKRAEAVGRVLDLLEGGKLIDEAGGAALFLLPPHMDRYGPRILAALATAIQGKEWWCLYPATEAINAIGPAARPVLPRLLEQLHAGQLNPLVQALLTLDPEGAAAIPAATGWLEDRKANARVSALQVLRCYGPKAAGATEAVRKRLQDRDAWVKRVAELTLSDLQAGA